MIHNKNNTSSPVYVIGMDFGSDSVRGILAEISTGKTVASYDMKYPRWAAGKYSDSSRCMFRHHPLDYIEVLEATLGNLVSSCGRPDCIKGIAIDSTASTPCLVDENCIPLSLKPEFSENPDAMFILWKDHTAETEAAMINNLIAREGLDRARCSGGHYSAECMWSKIMMVARNSPDVISSAHTAVELCDWLTAWLSGTGNTAQMKINACAPRLKQLWVDELGGYPPEDFFDSLDPRLWRIVRNMPLDFLTPGSPAGVISPSIASKFGLAADTIVAIGDIDSYAGAVGAGIHPGKIAMNMGTSACYMALRPISESGPSYVSGVFGQADGSIIDGYTGFEAGLSAFGDLYAWFRRMIASAIRITVDDGTGWDAQFNSDFLSRMAEKAASIKITPELPLATDHVNGRRSPEPSDTLTASICGLRVNTTSSEIFYAISESLAFASRRILDHLENNGVVIESLTAIGGISGKSPFLMQLMADVTGRDINVSDCAQACAQGALIHAATASGLFPDVKAAQDILAAGVARTYHPRREYREILDDRYKKYLHISHFNESLY